MGGGDPGSSTGCRPTTTMRLTVPAVLATPAPVSRVACTALTLASTTPETSLAVAVKPRRSKVRLASAGTPGFNASTTRERFAPNGWRAAPRTSSDGDWRTKFVNSDGEASISNTRLVTLRPESRRIGTEDVWPENRLVWPRLTTTSGKTSLTVTWNVCVALKLGWPLSDAMTAMV